MATFTIELRDAVQLTDGDIGLDSYPIFDEDYRPVLNGIILDHYSHREIGAETVDLFRHFLKRRMNEIMPYYNKLYESELMVDNPLLTVNVETVQESDTTNSTESDTVARSETESLTGSKSRSTSSEMPQVQLSDNGDYASAIADTIAENVSNAENNSGETTSVTGAGVATVTGTQKGFTGSINKLLTEHRETLMNIDMMVVDNLDNLFMGIWATSDNFLTGRL